jgi:thymidylate kinase
LTKIAIIDGVTGAGKTSVLTLLAETYHKGHWDEVVVIDEDRTLGNILDQYQNPNWRAKPTFEAIESTIAFLEQMSASANADRKLILVERLHLTTYALFPKWKELRSFDRRLGRLNAVNVLLTFPPRETEERSIERPDRADENWAARMDQWLGSRRTAVLKIRRSQQRRWQALALSRLSFLHIDTRGRDWTRYAKTIAAFLAPPTLEQD